jgi:predicted HD phosphohydrolase
MKKQRTAITGAEGRIGRLLRDGIRDREITSLDRNGRHAGHVESEIAPERLHGHETLIHLAWIAPMGPPPRPASYRDVLPSDNRHLANLELTATALRAAEKAAVPRVILASSVQADAFRDWVGPGLVSPDRIPRSPGPYGAAKMLVEEQGLHHAQRGFDVVCVRLGAVTSDGSPNPEDSWERRVWLSHRDCVEVFRACLDAPVAPGRFVVFHAVSSNEGRVHDTRNPFGWEPRDGALAEAGGATGTGPAAVRFTRLDDGTAEEFALTRECALRHNEGLADRMLDLLRGLAALPSRYPIDRMQHGLQAATRALRDGADEETVVCALFHDVATWFSTENHAAVAAEILRPYISPENRWMLAHHGEFQAYHFRSRSEKERNARERHRGHPCFERTVRFCERWDQTAFDPDYDTLPLEAFEPMVRRIFARRPGERHRSGPMADSTEEA